MFKIVQPDNQLGSLTCFIVFACSHQISIYSSHKNQKKKWKIEIFSKNIHQDKNFLEFVLKIKILKVEKIKNKNWLSFFKRRFFYGKNHRNNSDNCWCFRIKL